ncbi:hypothetical protein GTA08_BOTSDO03655 [Neofusicoccum parvum]|nr:hypothetical protein GTA08_BOTSDO03655 [Neofusicoccum parvum]
MHQLLRLLQLHPFPVAGQTYKRHPIQPSYETPTVRAQTRLNGTGVQRLVVKTGNRSVPENGTQTSLGSSTKATQTSSSLTKAQKSTSTTAPTNPTASKTPLPETTKMAAKTPVGAVAPPPSKPARAKLTKPAPAPAPAPAPKAVKPAANTAKTPAAASTAKKPVAPYSASAVLAARRVTVAAAAAAAAPAVKTQDSDAAHQPLISIRVSRQAVVQTLQLVAVVWVVVAAAYLLSTLGKALVVVFWPIGLVFKGVGALAGCVRGGGWGR